MLLELSKLCVGTFAFISLENFVKGVSEPVFNDQGRITSNLVLAHLLELSLRLRHSLALR